MRYVVFFLCALGYSFQLKAQRETSVWNFGNLAGMDFSTVPPAAITTSAINSYEGSASISDSNGRLIAYSNGLDVYNRENNLMQNGDNLVGDTNATHACIFLKQPLSERFYYLFTCSSDDIPGINYSVIDMQADNGNGAVIQKNIPLLASNSEKLAATYADNGQDIWLATMGPYNSDSLFLYKLTPLGLEPPVIHKLNYLIEKQGQIKFSRNGKLLAITSYGEGVLLLSFNAADGSISNERFINRGPLPNHTEQIYGLEFSPGYKYLYVALRRATAVYQCPLSAFSGSITTACTNINTTGYEFCQLQLGPDLKIYATSPGNAFLGCITRPDEPDTTCRLDANNIYLQGKQAREGLPSFLVSYFNIPDIRLTQTCLTDTTLIRFNLLADSIQWDLGDGNLVTTHNNTADSVLSYIYPNAQEYKIKATMFFSGDIDSASETVLIRHAKKPDLGHDTSFCHGDSLLLTYSDSVTTYLWQNGSTDSSIYVLDSGLYWLEVRDAFGCFSADTIQVDEVEFPNTNLGPDTNLCTTQTLTLSAFESGVEYTWHDGSTDPTYVVTQPGVYWVRTDRRGCLNVDSISIHYLQKPVAPQWHDTTVCDDFPLLLYAPYYPENTYLWNTTERDTSIETETSGQYKLVIQNQCGTDSAELAVNFVLCECPMYIPNAFSPNGDGVNEVFMPSFSCPVAAFDLKIYNQWGQLVFYSKDETKGWNGKEMEMPSPAGVYVWELRYTVVRSKGRVFDYYEKGNLALLR